MEKFHVETGNGARKNYLNRRVIKRDVPTKTESYEERTTLVYVIK